MFNMLKKMLFLVITIFFIFVWSTQATRINYKYDGWWVVKWTMFVYYPWVYKVVDNYGKVYKTYVWNWNPNHKEDRTVSFTADISDCKNHRFRLTYSWDNEWAWKCLTGEKTWHHFWKNPGCHWCFPMDNPWIKAPEYDCKKQFECPYPTKHDKPEFGKIANCHKVNFSTGVWYHCDFYSGLRDDFVPKSDNSGCYWRGKTNPVCWTSVNSCKKWTFIDIADTYSLNKWVCRNGNSDTVCVKFKKSPKCSWTKPSWEGIMVWTSKGKWTWRYVNRTPWACQWTCQNWYERQGNSCVRIPADDSCNSSIFSGVDTSGCNKCTVGWTVYKWEKISYLAHYFANPGSTNVISYTNDFSYDFKTLQDSTSWTHSNGNLFKYADWFTWNNWKYHVFKPWYKEKVMELAPWKGFSLYDVKEGANRNKFAFMVGFTDTYHPQIAVKPNPKYFPRFKVDVDNSKFGDYHGHTKYSPEFMFLYAKYKLGRDLTGKYSDYRVGWYRNGKRYMVLWTEENHCTRIFFEDLDKFTPPTTIGEAKTNRECVFYKPAFCWDGVVDSDKGEQCDPKANNNLPNGKVCSSTCKIVSKPVTCTWVKVDPTSGNAPLDANITCSWNNVTKGFKLAIIDKQWNVVSKNTNGKSFGYTFSKEWKYTLKCYADKQVTSNSCTTEVQVWSPKKADIKIIKSDLNLDDIDGKLWNDTQTIQKNNKSVFRIIVKNTWNVSLKNVQITDKLAPNCSGLFWLSSGWIWTPTTWLAKTFSMKNTNATFDPGETFSYVCISDKVSDDYTNTAKVTADPVDPNLGPVSDEDDSKVVIVKPKRCDIMNVSQSLIDITGKNGWKVDVICKWKDIKNYKILCWNGDVINSDKWTCIYEKPWNYNVVCQMDWLSGENCKKDVEIVKKTAPAIKIEKYSWNPNDLDANKDHNEADDTQTVAKWSKAVFTIKVTNIWWEVLKDVKVTDVVASACNNTIWELAINESRIYTCEKANTQGNYTNVAKVEAKGKTSNKLVDDEDDTEVKLEWPAIKIEKYSWNPDDLDWYKTHTEVDDSQTVSKWSKAVFTIKVTNIWTETLKDIKVTDELAPNCNNTFAVELKPNETRTYTCEKTNTQEDYINVAKVEAKGKISWENVNDEDDTKVKIAKPWIKIEKYSWNPDDLDWDKTHNEADDTQTVKKWSKSVFTIKVTNTWDIPLKNVRITDELAQKCSWEFKILINGQNWKNQYYNDIDLSNREWRLTPGSYFSYTCESDKVSDDYTNTAKVTADPVDPNLGPVSDEDDSKVVVLKWPVVKIEKYSWNPNDLDWNKAHTETDDTQTVAKWSEAVFTIKVTNIWSETLENVKVTDPRAPDCYKTIWELAVNESKTYTCKKADTQDSYTNIARVDAKGKDSWENVNDNDKTEVVIEWPAIKIEKYSWNPNDLDWNKTHTETDDSQTVEKWSEAVFTIKVTNIWTEVLKNTKVTDPRASDCNKTIWELAPNKSYTYTCKKSNTQSNYTNTAKVTAKGKNSNKNVNDEDDTKVVIEWPAIKIEKYSWNSDDLDWNKDHNEADDSQKVKKWSKAVFTIKVTNTWTEVLKDVKVTDELASDCNKDISWELAPNETRTYTCEKTDTQNNYTNTAIVTAKGKNSNKDVNNSDTTDVVVDSNPSPLTLRCTEETLSATTVKVWDEVDVTCKTNAELVSWIDEVEYKIDCWVNAQDWEITWTWTADSVFKGKCKYIWAVDTWSIKCYVRKKGSNTYKDPGTACTKPIKVTWNWPWTWGSWGWWTSLRCNKITTFPSTSWIEVTCWANETDLSKLQFKIDCWNGKNIYISWNDMLKWKQAICWYNWEEKQNIKCYVAWVWHVNYKTSSSCERDWIDWHNPAPKAKCWDGSVDKGETCDDWNTISGDWCNSNCQLETWYNEDNNSCWDGIKWERTDGWFDQCDFGSKLEWPEWCDKNTCKINLLTIPAWGDLVIEYPEINKIVWTWVSVFGNRLLGSDPKYDPQKVCLVNKWERTLAFEPTEKLVLISKKVNWLQVLGSKIEKEVNITNLINNSNNLLQPISYDPNAKICFTYNRNSTTTTEYLWTNDFWDVKVIATIHQGNDTALNNDLDWAYFARISNIRVARPWIVTTGWWDASYNTNNSTSDIHNVTWTDYNIVWANAWNTSSYTATWWNTPTTWSLVSVDTTWYSASWENYNWLDNVYIYKWDTKINWSTPVISWLSNPTTLIVEWDLTIDGNIEPNKNIAVIVKNWDLKIKSNVTKLKWTYIVINWKITWEVNNTDQLVIKGSLYWDVNDLISKRTYVDWTAWGDTLDVWTILDFNSSVYEDQAPLLSKFLDEYFQASRTAN